MNSRSELISKYATNTSMISQEVFSSVFEDSYRYFSLDLIEALCPTIAKELLLSLERFGTLEPKAKIELFTQLFNFVQDNYPELLI